MNASLYLRKSNLLKSLVNKFSMNKFSFNYSLNLKDFTEKAKSQLNENINTQSIAVNNKIESFITSKYFYLILPSVSI